MKKVFLFVFGLLLTLGSCSDQPVSSNEGGYRLPNPYTLPLPAKERVLIANEVLQTASLPNLRESFSKFSIGAKEGDLIGLFQSDRLLYIMADQSIQGNKIREYYFYDAQDYCYFAAVFSGNDPLLLNTYWMPKASDSVFVETYSLNASLGYALIPSEAPISHYALGHHELEGHILPKKIRAFLNQGVVETQVSQTGMLVKKMPMSANQSGVDKGLLKPGQTLRYQMDLNPQYIYTVAVNPLDEGFMLRGIDGDKVFIEGVTDFQWFTDKVKDSLFFEIYNEEIQREAEYRIGVFPELRF
jgi:hypothetical protein